MTYPPEPGQPGPQDPQQPQDQGTPYQQPQYAQAQYAEAQPARPRPSARRGPMLVIGLVVGLVLGGGGVALGWWLSGRSSASGAAADAQAACELVERAPAFGTEFDMETDYPAFLRWGAGVQLAMAAAEADPRYQSLVDALRSPVEIFQTQFSSDSPEFADAVGTAREACARY